MSDTNPQSPGGTTVENGIETVTVEATKLINWKQIAIALAVAAVLYKMLNS